MPSYRTRTCAVWKCRIPISLFAAVWLGACAAGQQSTYNLSLFDPGLPVLCRVYLDSALTNVVEVKTTASDCVDVTNRLKGWSMEAFIDQDGKLVPAAEYLAQARQNGRRPQVRTAKDNRLVSVIGRFNVEGEWEGRTWEERFRPQFVDIDRVIGYPLNIGVLNGVAGDFSRLGDGWLRVLLPPGTYVMGLAPRYDKAYRPLKIVVPENTENIYIGSYRFKCRGQERGFNMYPLTCTDQVVISDEKAAAARVMRISLQNLRTVSTYPYGKDFGSGYANEEAIWPKRVALNKTWRLTIPDWSRLNVTETYPERSETTNFAASLVGAAAQGAAEGIVYGTGGLIILPFAIAGLANSRDLVNRWTPCVAKLDARLKEADLEKLFRSHLRFHNPASQSATKSKGNLTADIHRIILRKCTQPKTYCVEVAVRVRMGSGSNTRYDRIHVYSSREGKHRDRRWPGHNYWENPVEAISSCRDIGEYCTQDGHQLALREVENALDAIASKVVRELLQDPQNVQ